MVHWMVWGFSALLSRTSHTISRDYYNKYIDNGFEHVSVNIYLFFLVTLGKLFVNPTFNITSNVIIFGATNSLFPYWYNKAKEILPDSSFPMLITHSDPLFSTIISPMLFNSDNRIPMLYPMYCMTVGKLLIIHYDNPYSRIAVDEESLQQELRQPILHDHVLSNIHFGFATLSLSCIIIKDIALSYASINNICISDLIFMHQVFALLFSVFQKYHKNIDSKIIYNNEIGTPKAYSISTVLLLNNGFINFFYISSLYNCYSNIPNIGYAKIFVNFYVPIMWGLKLSMAERHCNEYYIGGYYCYFLSFFGLIYFGR